MTQELNKLTNANSPPENTEGEKVKEACAYSAQGEMIKSLIQAQSEFPKIEKDKNNPYFKSKYADLSSIMKIILPILNKNGIGILQPISHDVDHNGKPLITVTTRIIHVSGVKMDTDFCLPIYDTNIQKIVAQVSYMRRIAITSLFGLAPEDEDDDGNTVVGNQTQPPVQQRQATQQTTQQQSQEEVAKQQAKILSDLKTSIKGRLDKEGITVIEAVNTRFAPGYIEKQWCAKYPDVAPDIRGTPLIRPKQDDTDTNGLEILTLNDWKAVETDLPKLITKINTQRKKAESGG